jgi:hypothetical protein
MGEAQQAKSRPSSGLGEDRVRSRSGELVRARSRIPALWAFRTQLLSKPLAKPGPDPGPLGPAPGPDPGLRRPREVTLPRSAGRTGPGFGIPGQDRVRIRIRAFGKGLLPPDLLGCQVRVRGPAWLRQSKPTATWWARRTCKRNLAFNAGAWRRHGSGQSFLPDMTARQDYSTECDGCINGTGCHRRLFTAIVQDVRRLTVNSVRLGSTRRNVAGDQRVRPCPIYAACLNLRYFNLLRYDDDETVRTYACQTTHTKTRREDIHILSFNCTTVYTAHY